MGIFEDKFLRVVILMVGFYLVVVKEVIVVDSFIFFVLVLFLVYVFILFLILEILDLKKYEIILFYRLRFWFFFFFSLCCEIVLIFK